MATTNWIQLINQIISNTLETRKFCNIVIGKIEAISPLEIRMNQKIILPSDFFIMPEYLNQKISSWRIGEEIILIREEGGQRFLIIDKVVRL